MVLSALLVAATLVFLALGVVGGDFVAVTPRDPRWIALTLRAPVAFAAAVFLAVALALIGHDFGCRAARALATALGLVALAVADAVYGGAPLATSVVATVCAAIALGGLIAALALTSRARLLRQPLPSPVPGLLKLSVGALALQGLLLLGQVGLALPGPSPRPLLHGLLATWFWLRLLAGLALPLGLGALAMRASAGTSAHLVWLLAALVGLLTFGEFSGRELSARVLLAQALSPD